MSKVPRTVDEELFDSLEAAITHAADGGPGGRVRIQSWRCISKTEKELATKADVTLISVDKDGEEIDGKTPTVYDATMGFV